MRGCLGEWVGAVDGDAVWPEGPSSEYTLFSVVSRSCLDMREGVRGSKERRRPL